MEEAKLTLHNPPIIEAVLDIDCDLPPGWQLSAMESDAKKCFDDQYPKFRMQFVQEHQIVASESGGEPVVSTRHGVQAFQFLQDDEKQLVQVRNQGFSFNRLAPYTSLDDYLPEIKRCWALYVGLVAPVQIRLIRLRYINRIVLQTPGEHLELADFFKVGPRLPDEENLLFTGFLNQHSAVEVSSGHEVNIVLASQPQEGDKLPVIFDNTVVARKAGEPENMVWLLATIQSLRDLKNHIFKNTLTERCLKLFQQPQ